MCGRARDYSMSSRREHTLGMATRCATVGGSSYLTGQRDTWRPSSTASVSPTTAGAPRHLRLSARPRRRYGLTRAAGYIAATMDALWSLYDGRFDDAEAAICAAERFGHEFGGTTARPGGRPASASCWLASGATSRASPEFLDPPRRIPTDGRPHPGVEPRGQLAARRLRADRRRRRPAAADRRADRRLPGASPRAPPHRRPGLRRRDDLPARPGRERDPTRSSHRPPSVRGAPGAPRPAGAARLAGRPSRSDAALRRAGGSRERRTSAGGLRDLHAALRRSASAPHRARILVDIASVLERVRPAAARRALDQGHRLAEEIGMQALATV